MKSYMRISAANGETYDLSLRHDDLAYSLGQSVLEDAATPAVIREDTYTADHVGVNAGPNIVDITFVADTLAEPVRFILESFSLGFGEEGTWTLTVSHRSQGPPDYSLEYFTTIDEFGERVRRPTVFSWDMDRNEMVAN
jgi:hypothetical protein